MSDDTSHPTDEGPTPWWTSSTTTIDPPAPPSVPTPAPTGPGAPRPRAGRMVAAGAVVLAVALASGVTGAELVARHDPSAPAATPTVTSGQAVTAGTTPSETLAKVAAAVQPSVVSITVTASAGSDEGSGVIMRSDGTILTNNHVISAAAGGGGTIEVTFSDGSTAKATIVGRDESTDLAVIKAAGVSGLKPATFGDSDGVSVGDTVLAIGSPLGLEGSVTSGIVSALHRPVQSGDGATSTAVLSDAIQTDAAINPGNSGGPLVDATGRVIGINSAIAALSSGTDSQSGSIGVGFAIPVDEATRVARQLIAGETVTHAVLGVQVSDVSGGGARVEAVTSGGGAADAGIQVGDVVTALDGTTVDDATALTAAVRAHQPGDRVRVTLTRSGRTEKVTVTLGSAS
jgi:putative serine protease PepD